MIFATASAVLAMSQSRPAQAGCSSDSECKGARICEDGRCVDPTQAETQSSGMYAPAVAPAPATSAAPSLGMPQPAPMLATLTVIGDRTGAVTLDGQYRGETPAQIPNLASGAHRLVVTFEDGSTYEEDLDLLPGESRQSMARPSEANRAAAARAGVHLGVEAGAGPWARDADHFGGGGEAGVYTNIGLARVLELRIGVRTGIGYTKHNNYLLTIPANLRFNLGSVYTMAFGTNFGWIYDKQSAVLYGAEVSLLTFRFGSTRRFELALVNGIGVYQRDGTKAFSDANLTFSMLL